MKQLLCIFSPNIHMQLWKSQNSRGPQHDLVMTVPCSLLGVNMFTVLSYEWTTCSLNVTDPIDACTPVDPAPFDSHHHVALVPTCKRGLNSDCSLEEKAKNLGQANYVAFITWDDYNCPGSELVKGVVCWDGVGAVYCLLEHVTCINGLQHTILYWSYLTVS